MDQRRGFPRRIIGALLVVIGAILSWKIVSPIVALANGGTPDATSLGLSSGTMLRGVLGLLLLINGLLLLVKRPRP